MEQLKQINQWTLWKLKKHETRKGKLSKVPVGINQRAISIHNEQEWKSFDNVITLYLNNPDKYDGVGFIFTENDPYVGIDIDSASNMYGWQEIVKRFGSYTERSPSKTGLHIITKGFINNTHGVKAGDHDKGEIAIYDANRFFTVTLDNIKNMETIKENQNAINWLVKSLDDKSLINNILQTDYSDKFITLWEGKWSNKYSSQSEADLAFCRILANNHAPMHQIDRIFRKTKLMRDKWLEKRGTSTYGLITLEKALYK